MSPMYTGNMLMNALIETLYEYDDANHANCSGPFLSGRQSLIGARIGACADLIFFFFPIRKPLAQQFLAQPRHKNRRFLVF
jgi:hypothetical protein